MFIYPNVIDIDQIKIIYQKKNNNTQNYDIWIADKNWMYIVIEFKHFYLNIVVKLQTSRPCSPPKPDNYSCHKARRWLFLSLIFHIIYIWNVRMTFGIN